MKIKALLAKNQVVPLFLFLAIVAHWVVPSVKASFCNLSCFTVMVTPGMDAAPWKDTSINCTYTNPPPLRVGSCGPVEITAASFGYSVCTGTTKLW